MHWRASDRRCCGTPPDPHSCGHVGDFQVSPIAKPKHEPVTRAEFSHPAQKLSMGQIADGCVLGVTNLLYLAVVRESFPQGTLPLLPTLGVDRHTHHDAPEPRLYGAPPGVEHAYGSDGMLKRILRDIVHLTWGPNYGREPVYPISVPFAEGRGRQVGTCGFGHRDCPRVGLAGKPRRVHAIEYAASCGMLPDFTRPWC